MLRRGERIVVGTALLIVGLAALAGVLVAPTQFQDDPRLSTYRAGPQGAKGLAETLRRLGITVAQRRRPYFDVANDSAPPSSTALLAFLDIARPTTRELTMLRTHVARGGRIFTAGVTGVENCFGYFPRRLGRGADSSRVRASAAQRLPLTHRILARLRPDSLPKTRTGTRDDTRCLPLRATRTDTLLATGDGRPVALRLGFSSGGEA
ncbi:MAG TPA: DUF4350 domain-containing protein, partial [Gemmatimonadales bacterium]|nr:DUF4350 domain-containing protein [Gemmatimonadales bacterium]